MKNILLVLACLTFFAALSQNNKRPAGFIENKGQIVNPDGTPNPRVHYLLNTNGLNVQLRSDGFSYDVYQTEKRALNQEQKSALACNFNSGKSPDDGLVQKYHRIDIDFENANKSVRLIAEGKSSGHDNYYNLAHAPKGIHGVHKFQKVTYKNLYNHIDVVFFIPEDASKAVEYNFIIYPGGKISDIKMKIKGAKTDLAGNAIRMEVRFGQMQETLPLSWTEEGETKTLVAISYKKISKNVYGFESPKAPSDKMLIIDPVPTRLWGTYYGGSSNDYGNDVCTDSQNNSIISGYTFSTDNIATSGSYIDSYESYYHGAGYIVKFNLDGVRLWGIYYSIAGKVVKTDGADNIYFTGTDQLGYAPNVATADAHKPTMLTTNYGDAFLVKLNPSGVRLWGTYYGGDGSEKGNDITFDSDDNVYLAGTADSVDEISTPGTHQPVHGAGYLDSDGFIVKFSPAGVRLWGTYYGGTNSDQLLSCNISDDGFLYVTGTTRSAGAIATEGSYHPVIAGSFSGVIAKFDLNGQRIWGSYFNGLSNAQITRSAIKGGFLYLIGVTNSHNNLNSAGTYNPVFVDLPMNYGFSSFVAKFDLGSQTLDWGTYFGDYIQDIEINSDGDIFFTGCTDDLDDLATLDAYKTTRQYSDSYLIKLDQDGNRIWGTYYGGNITESHNGAADVCNMMSLDQENNIYLFGNTQSTQGISTPGAHQENYFLTGTGSGRVYDVFLAKLQDCPSSPKASGNSPVCIGSTIELTASGGTDYAWTGPNGFTSTLPNPTIPDAAVIHAGEYSCMITGTGGCDGLRKVTIVVGDPLKPVPNLTPLPAITGDCTTVVNTVPTATDACAGSITATTGDTLSYTLPGNYTIHWTYDDGNGNIETQEQTVTINAVALPTVASPQSFCIQQNATLGSVAITAQQLKWYDAMTGGNLLAGNTPLTNRTYYASQTINNCESLRVAVDIYIQDTPAPTGQGLQELCATQHPTLGDIATDAVNVGWYESVSGTTILPVATMVANGTTYYATQTINGCESTNRLAVTVNLTNTVNASDYSTTICDEQNDGSQAVDLTAYQVDLVSNPATYTFGYYQSLSGAQSQSTTELITNMANYQLGSGPNSIYVRVTSSNGCSKVVTLALNLVDKPKVTIPDMIPLCQRGNITVDAGAGFDSYTWSNTQVSRFITVSQPGDYFVTVTKSHQGIVCSSTKNFQVVLSDAATITGIDIRDWTDSNNVITVNTNGYGDYEFSLDGINYQSSNVFSGLATGNYTVYVKDKNGCGISKEDVYLLSYPKFFTPNADGHNDTWSIRFSYFEPGLTVSIFDRYGKLLASLGNKASWDGKYNGHDLPATDYWFLVTRADGKEYRGHFTLER